MVQSIKLAEMKFQESVRYVRFVVWFCLIQLSTVVGIRYTPKPAQCERITMPMCADMKYNLTQMPNLLGHLTQKEASDEINEFIPLVRIGCSRLLKFFLCSQYAPMCTEQVDETLVIPPCRSLCLDVKSSCQPILMRFDFRWPASLDCNALPERSDRIDLCIEPPKDGEPNGDEDPMIPGSRGDFLGDLDDLEDVDQLLKESYLEHGERATKPSQELHKELGSVCSSNRFLFVNKFQLAVDSCVRRCYADVLFSISDKRFMDKWIKVWSGLSLAASVFTIVSFLVGVSRFRYPERPIIFIVCCCAFYSGAHVLRAIAGSDVISCDRTQTGAEYQMERSLQNVWCTAVFMLLYYSGMAGCLWWVVLTITWYLAAGRKWGEESVAALNKYFHMVVWTIPAVKMVAVMSLQWIEGEELTGLCQVGNRDKMSRSAFVLAPMALYLAVGIGFTAAGFASACKVRRELKHGLTNTHRLDRLMTKMGIVSILYALPTMCLLGCLFYEHRNIDGWLQRSRNTKPCKWNASRWNDAGQTNPFPDCQLEESVADVEVFYVKVFMSLVTGITSGMWIWSFKTLAKWTNYLRKACSCLPSRRPQRTSTSSAGQRAKSPLIGSVSRATESFAMFPISVYQIRTNPTGGAAQADNQPSLYSSVVNTDKNLGITSHNRARIAAGEGSFLYTHDSDLCRK